ILLINLSKGLVGDVNMRLLGSMLTTRIFLGAMSRANLAPDELKKTPKFYLYVDEFQNFANDTFAEILSEARKYNLNLIIAHQYVEQMEEEVRAAVFGNVGTTVAFRVGPFDAELLETVFSPEFLKEDLVNLGFAQVYMSLMIDGIGSRPFSAITIPPIEQPARSFKKEVIDASRSQFGTARAGVEELIYSELMPPTPPVSAPKKETISAAQAYATRPRTPSTDTEERPRRTNPETPRRDASRRDTPPRDRSNEERRPAPPKEKSADDLKAILRSTIAKAEGEKSARIEKKETGLKDALKEAAGHMPPKPEPPQESEPRQTPFEVPESTLRSLFKDV
ncbi:MAG: TraM recognition domain-containing protein, partial [Patescibacteria group bacterium]